MKFVSFAAVVFLFAFTASQASHGNGGFGGNGEAYVSDGCYYINDQIFGCMKSTLYSCDYEWFFQLTTPVSEEFPGSFIIADGIVPIYQDYYQIFTIQNEDEAVEFSISFFDAEYEGDRIIVQGQFVYNNLNTNEQHAFPITDYIVTGMPCDEGYLALPCPSSSQREYDTTVGAEVMTNTFNQYIHSSQYADMFHVQEDCLILRSFNSRNNLGPFFCPTVLYDACAMRGMLTSRAGLTVKSPLSPGYGEPTCVQFSDGYSFCMNPQLVTFESDYVGIPDILFTLERDNDVLAEWLISGLDFLYPMCGEDHFSCLQYYSFSLPSYQYFTTGFWSELFSDDSFSTIDLSEFLSMLFTTYTWSTESSWWNSSFSLYSTFSFHSSSSSSSSSSTHSGENGGAITGIVFGALGGIAIIVALFIIAVVVILKGKKSQSTDAVYELMTNQEE